MCESIYFVLYSMLDMVVMYPDVAIEEGACWDFLYIMSVLITGNLCLLLARVMIL